MKKHTILILIISLTISIIIIFYLYSQNITLKKNLSRTERFLIENEIENKNLERDNTVMINDFTQEIKSLKEQLNRIIYNENKRKEIENNRFDSYRVLKDLKLKQNPDIYSTNIMEIKKNSIVKIQSGVFGNFHIKKNYPIEWWKIEYNGKKGWVIFNSSLVDFKNGVTGGESLLIIQ